jgi:hypothetical protein
MNNGYFRTKILPITVGSLKSVPLGESMQCSVVLPALRCRQMLTPQG